MNRSWLILGGARAGKTARALALSKGYRSRVYIATAEIRDEEMRERVTRHRTERESDWINIEAAVALAEAIRQHDALEQVIVVDCLTLWLSNLMERDLSVESATEELVAVITKIKGAIIFVSNEVGFGIVPDNALARAFRDAQGRLNQTIAASVNCVELVVAGLPMKIKG
ncbi:MAG TPA: bifunctional adenosylcobinamide kinase/adenosylcobinamide-phosphate guanylyltransferase [Rhizomicrobium sp.]|jgi:adenosylcobinamide kinase/adenosylcobinamide-phosphate guanylyltransferase|nr:bifunctional adenosylcobinamide kinase/adenosylcobinamide-phosphate guanylyltransferase [Rhizomicrobium sp.]